MQNLNDDEEHWKLWNMILQFFIKWLNYEDSESSCQLLIVKIQNE